MVAEGLFSDAYSIFILAQILNQQFYPKTIVPRCDVFRAVAFSRLRLAAGSIEYSCAVRLFGANRRSENFGGRPTRADPTDS
jgi:hypothetical protein